MGSDTNIITIAMATRELYAIAALRHRLEFQADLELIQHRMQQSSISLAAPKHKSDREIVAAAGAEAEKSPPQAAPMHKSDREVVLDAGAEAEISTALNPPYSAEVNGFTSYPLMAPCSNVESDDTTPQALPG